MYNVCVQKGILFLQLSDYTTDAVKNKSFWYSDVFQQTTYETVDY